MKYWVICIEALNGILTDSIANNEIVYTCKGVEDISKGDYILGYLMSPIGKITMLWSATKNAKGDKLFAKKHMDIVDGCTINEKLYEKVLEVSVTERKCFEITKNDFEDIISNLIQTVNSKGQLLTTLRNDGSSLIPKIQIDVEENLTIDQLSGILKDMYTNPSIVGKAMAPQLFGLKYGKIIIDKKYSVLKIVLGAGLTKSYGAEVQKGINTYKALCDQKAVLNVENARDEITENADDEIIVRVPRTNKIHPLNCILYGAPGTGKTYATAEYALAFIENRDIDFSKKSDDDRKLVMEKYNKYIKDGQIVFTTFHQSYSYEDFIQGLRPNTSGDAEKSFSFDTVDGVFKVIADRAKGDLENDYVIIIDEINRANISKVFGELITLIEPDKRDGEINAINVTLPSGQEFSVPNNLYIIGTMNSADKSISLIDTALRRRFNFIEVIPRPELIDNLMLREIMIKLNNNLVQDLDSTDLLIGHSYFMGKNEADICDIMNNNIIPLLYEYFYDNRKKVESHIRSAISGLSINLELKNEPMGRLKVKFKD